MRAFRSTTLGELIFLGRRPRAGGSARRPAAHVRISGIGIRISRTSKQGFPSLSSSVCLISIPPTTARLQNHLGGNGDCEGPRQGDQRFGNDVRAQLAEPVAEMEEGLPRRGCHAFVRAYWSDTIPLRVLHLEVRCKKGDGDGHPSLR